MTTSLTAYELLTGAAYLVGLPGAWVQGRLRQMLGSRDGREWGPIGWCPVGAVDDQCWGNGPARAVALHTLMAVVWEDPTKWNDTPGRTQAEVVAALLAAAEKVKPWAPT